MSGKFFITKTPKGFYRFSLLAGNHEKVLTSQNYVSLSNCRAGINTIKRNALSHIEDKTLKNAQEKKFPKYEVYFDNAGFYRYRMLAANGQNIAMVEDGYPTKQGCLSGIEAISRAAVEADIDDSSLKQ